MCSGDGRTVAQRCPDACFALLSGTVFECRCGSAECTAVIPEPGTVPPMTGAAIVHVIADASTVAAATATPADEVATPDEGRVSAGFLIGHELIADTQVAEIVTRPGRWCGRSCPRGPWRTGMARSPCPRISRLIRIVRRRRWTRLCGCVMESG
ncbi:DUF222 domain-containing protein [Gordonia oryzae]|uniref:DUF222 domain-containing protein n=1 Tax=Gordonia oryzae TaxID=2487349 RepID=A0A3N4H4I4_9ACTN|nr:DUF222 domain-containing protein [Gordonia oryzae]